MLQAGLVYTAVFTAVPLQPPASAGGPQAGLHIKQPMAAVNVQVDIPGLHGMTAPLYNMMQCEVYVVGVVVEVPQLGVHRRHDATQRCMWWWWRCCNQVCTVGCCCTCLSQVLPSCWLSCCHLQPICLSCCWYTLCLGASPALEQLLPTATILAKQLPVCHLCMCVGVYCNSKAHRVQRLGCSPI